MKKTAVFAVLLLCITAVLTAGCVTTDEPAEPIDYPTALIGEWKSEKTEPVSETVEFYTIYHFNDDNTGTVRADVDGVSISSLDIFWGYDGDNHYVVGYPKSQQVISYYLHEDGKSFVDDFGNKFIKL